MNLTPRCETPLAGTGGEPCQAPAGHAGRGHDLSGQSWSHAYVNMELAHAEALAENEAHDLAMEKAQELDVALLVQFATPRCNPPGALPQALRNRLHRARGLIVVPPGRMQA